MPNSVEERAAEVNVLEQDLRRWLSATEAMQYLGVSKTTFYRLVKDGRVKQYVLEGINDARYDRFALDRLLKPKE